jgi:hypothetical protein
MLLDHPDLDADIALLYPPQSLQNLMHRLVTLNRPPRTTELPRMLLGPHLFRDSVVILLQDIVQILNRPITATGSQNLFLLGFGNCARRTLGLVGVDYPRLRVRSTNQCFGEQRFGRIGGT